MTAKTQIPSNLQDGINLTVNNAENLFKAANTITSIGNYGLANSLYILCCEEAIKAFAIFQYLKTDDERDIKAIFYSHIDKLKVLKEVYHYMRTETLAMKESISKASTECSDKNKNVIEAKASEIHPDIFNRIFNDYKEKDFDNKWWSKANISKQNGFYVGFDENSWQSPENISIEELKITQEKALLIIGHILQYRDIKTTN